MPVADQEANIPDRCRHRVGPVAVASGVTAPDADAHACIRPAPPWLARLWNGRISAMTLPGTILVRPDLLADVVAGGRPALLRHEIVHLAQWRRDGPFRFLASYLLQYASARMAGMPHDVAYRGISYERQAVAAEAGPSA